MRIFQIFQNEAGIIPRLILIFLENVKCTYKLPGTYLERIQKRQISSAWKYLRKAAKLNFFKIYLKKCNTVLSALIYCYNCKNAYMLFTCANHLVILDRGSTSRHLDFSIAARYSEGQRDAVLLVWPWNVGRILGII